MATTNYHRKFTHSFFLYADELVIRKRQAGRYSTAELYRASSNWLRKFLGTDRLAFAGVTSTLVERFHAYLQSQQHLKINSINSYMSNLRAIYHVAVREGYVKRDLPDPFAHLQIQREKTAKRAVTLSVLEEVANLKLDDSPALQQAQDFCLFSFLACGIPFVDLVHLTSRNIIGNDLVYNRIKTGTAIRVTITPGMWRIIHKYAMPGQKYLFPVLNENDSYGQYKRALRKYNERLKDIGDFLTVPFYFTSYVIRHTWATEALRKNIPVAIISQALGHTQEKTTRSYLATLDQSELSAANIIITRSLDALVGVRA